MAVHYWLGVSVLVLKQSFDLDMHIYSRICLTYYVLSKTLLYYIRIVDNVLCLKVSIVSTRNLGRCVLCRFTVRNCYETLRLRVI